MPEILLTLLVLGILLTPQLIAGFMARSMGRKFWFWFGISFILPVISIIILVFLEDKAPGKKHQLADHIKD
jgi:MFS family permease